MHKGEVIFEVARPPSEVWERLVDMERAPDWVDSMKSSTKRTPGPVGVGAIFDQVLELNGSTNQAELKVTIFEERASFAHAGQSGPAAFTARFDLQEVPGGTRVVHGFTVSVGGMMRMMEPVIGGWVNKNARESVFKLKQLIETS